MINEKMRALGCKRSTIRELFEYGKQLSEKIGADNVFDFSLGNPSVEPPRLLTEKLAELLRRENPTALHGYTSADGDMGVRTKIAEGIKNSFGVSATYENIYMTVGAAAALTSVLSAIVNPGEEVILLAPYFPEYTVFASTAGAEVRTVPCTPDTFEPDVELIKNALNEKTAAVIINSPNNPSGAVYSAEILAEIAGVLKEKSREYGKPIYIISDEPYRELVYDGKTVPFIPAIYDNTVVCYSYSKSLSIPGDRIGYVFVPDAAEDSYMLMRAVAGAARSLGYVCAPSLLQRLIGECMGLTADISVYESNRNLLTYALRSFGFTVTDASGAFYLFVKSPSGDGQEFSDTAKKLGLLLVPSEDFGYAGYVRIAYCQKKEMIERSLPKFRELSDEYRHRGAI